MTDYAIQKIYSHTPFGTVRMSFALGIKSTYVNYKGHLLHYLLLGPINILYVDILFDGIGL